MGSFTQIGALTDFSAGTKIKSSEVDANFSAIRTQFNALVTTNNTINADTISEVTSGGGVTIDSVLLKDGGVTASGNASIGGTLSVTGAATLSSTLAVTGLITASGGVSGALNGTVGATTPAAGSFTTLAASSTLSVTGAATLSSTLAVTGNATVGGTLGVTGDVTCSGGDLTVQHASGAATINIETISGQQGLLVFRDDATGERRWELGKNASAESGSDAGSDFVLRAVDDDNQGIGTALSIVRSTMAATFGAGLTVTGDLLPATDSAHDLGATATRWATGYFDNLEVTQIGAITPGSAAFENITAGGNLVGNGLSSFNGDVNLGAEAADKIGFHGATAVAQQTVTGARDDPEAALAGLLTALATLGLIVDSTTAS